MANYKINFDMDGTIANLYGASDWLEQLRAYEPAPYMEATPLVNLSLLARLLNKLQRMGAEINIISWLAKNSIEEYDNAVAEAKLDWLAEHMPSVKWDNIIIVPYGYSKDNFCENENAILFDDEERNRNEWSGMAYSEAEIIEVLKNLLKGGE